MYPNHDIYFDGLNIASIQGVSVYNYKPHNLPTRELNTNKIANKDYSVNTRAEYVVKEIPIYLRIGRDDRAGTELAFNEVKAAFQKRNGTLSIPLYGTTVNWTATLYDIDHEKDGPYIFATVIMQASDPIGVENIQTVGLAGTAISTQAQDVTWTVEGSYKASPLIQLTYTSVTDATDGTVTIKNSQTGQGITITRTWGSTDVLEIDVENHVVTVNGSVVDYSGAFPTFKSGAAIVGYTDTFTDRDATLRVTYYRKFL